MNKIELANRVPVDNLVGAKTGRNYELTSYMYGCLDPRSNAPLSNVSVTGNSLSIDIWTGCPLQCAYCHVQGVKEDLNQPDWKMRTRAVRRTSHSIDRILSELIEHPLFEKDKTILSVCTSSTEPFLGDNVIESTITIMEWFRDNGFKNPFWIVTKAGIPGKIIDRMKSVSKTNRIIISICWANNDASIEPYRMNRFLNADKFRDTPGVFITWYLRPLVKEWNNNFIHLEDMFKKVSYEYKGDIHSIAAGGLRWTEGIEYGIKEIRGLPLPQNVNSASRHTKTLTTEDFRYIAELSGKYFGEQVPVYLHSSCMLSEILNINNIAMTNYFKKAACKESVCTAAQRKKCDGCLRVDPNLDEINNFLHEDGIDIEIKGLTKNNDVCKIMAEPELDSFSAAISQRIVTLMSEFMDVPLHN